MTRTDRLNQLLAYALVIAAFGGSYAHVVETVREKGQTGVMSYLIAAMPEVTTYLALVKLSRDRRSWAAWLILASSVAFSLAANLAQSGAGLGAHIVAAWPAYSAIAALSLAGLHGPKAKATPKATATRTRVAFEHTTATAYDALGQDQEVVAHVANERGRRRPEPEPVVVAEVVESEPRAITATRAPRVTIPAEIVSQVRIAWEKESISDESIAQMFAASGYPISPAAARSRRRNWEGRK